MTGQQKREWVELTLDMSEENALTLPSEENDGLYDRCIVGIARQGGMNVPMVVYDAEALIDGLAASEGLDGEPLGYEDAMDHFSYNISGGYVGETTPLFIDLCPQTIGLEEAQAIARGVEDTHGRDVWDLNPADLVMAVVNEINRQK